MNTHVLSPEQQTFLEIVQADQKFSGSFVLSGGTALVAYYIPYRLSEDLDFFSQAEVDSMALLTQLRVWQPKIKFKVIETSTSFNRNLFFLHFAESELKCEFTYYPFASLEKPLLDNQLRVDSLLDITVNKLFTIYQKPRSRDFMDLYQIIQQKKWAITDLQAKARLKFDTPLDTLQLGSQFLKARELKDYPHLVQPMPEADWQDFFIDQAKQLGSNIFSL